MVFQLKIRTFVKKYPKQGKNTNKFKKITYVNRVLKINKKSVFIRKIIVKISYKYYKIKLYLDM